MKNEQEIHNHHYDNKWNDEWVCAKQTQKIIIIIKITMQLCWSYLFFCTLHIWEKSDKCESSVEQKFTIFTIIKISIWKIFSRFLLEFYWGLGMACKVQGRLKSDIILLFRYLVKENLWGFLDFAGASSTSSPKVTNLLIQLSNLT
jgi:hypothetical protein